eukprot:TRINITY_DN1158_c1_g1_i1.p1 TRINITY_DN1158_c1_g1~~TRINITY_DN1158_c1_g1_i1.p1  ORF type:complete len:498 (+),score=111.84 TRINITY_DN1158_c1_g1_i1:67-1560(+)
MGCAQSNEKPKRKTPPENTSKPSLNEAKDDGRSKKELKKLATLRHERTRVGCWLPHAKKIDEFLKRLAKLPKLPLIEPIAELKNMVNDDLVLKTSVDLMFKEANRHRALTPLGTAPVENFEDFLQDLNKIMHTAPAFYTAGKNDDTAAGLIGFPVNALLDWPMATSHGHEVFNNVTINKQFKKILNHWSKFLVKKESRYVLTTTNRDVLGAYVIPWLSDDAKKQVVAVAYQATDIDPSTKSFEDVFQCDPTDEHYGFESWDNFFVRKFRDDIRFVTPEDDANDDVIVNACESAPFRKPATKVKLSDTYWLKQQPYSIQDMMDEPDSITSQFAGGTVYQAFLSALSYHRWNSPVTGTVVKQYVISGSYYLENAYEGFTHPRDGDSPDPSAPNSSQPFLSAVATRGIIFLESDNPKIGLMCFIAIGMGEVSSCEITVQAGQKVRKGEELGMFHFGGSTHCLLFRDGVDLEFVDFESTYKTTPGPDATNVPVKAKLATVK